MRKRTQKIKGIKALKLEKQKSLNKEGKKIRKSFFNGKDTLIVTKRGEFKCK